MQQPFLRWFALVVCLLTPAVASAQKLVTAGGAGTSPAVRVVDASGTDQTFLAYPAGFPGGVRVALGDVTGDGVLDIITAAGPGGGPHVRVWNGTDLTEVGGFFAYDPAFPGGVFVAAGDVNGDGRADIITGAGAGGGPHVRIWDGATFSEIGGFFAYDPAFPGGVNVAAGDVNGDGLADIITGAGPGAGPHVRVWNGATLTELGGFFAYDPAFPGGVNVAAGDVNGDGLADVITGAGPGGGPHVRVWNGATLTELGGFFAYDPAFTGGVVVGTVDLDRDGRNELITGPALGSPLIRLWTGTTFALFGEYFAYDPALGGNGVFVGSASENPSTDDAPRVASSVPANNATGVLVDADLTVTFSEAVTAGVGAFVLECPAGTAIPLTTITPSPATTFTLHPTSPLPVGTACTLRVVATQITDEDTDDPPDTMTANATVSFTTSACATITVSPTTVPGGNVSLAYGPVTFTQVGGTAPITWTVSAGTLPGGMNLSAAGVLSGTPTQAGAFPMTITATATGGCTGSVSLTLNIAAGPNVAPSFTGGANQTVLEDAGAQTVAAWATAISPGPPAEAAQTVNFNITGNTNAALFSAGPAVSPTGTLTYTPAANANGTATITLVLMDNGGTALGGVDTSAPQTFTITVTAVNDVPSFAVGPNQTVLENAGPQTVTPWAIAISPGPANESAQTVTFNITGNTNAALFSAGPAVSPTGTLTYTPAANTSGTATITLALQDNGGTANGGVDTSPGLPFTITVTLVDDPPTADNDSYSVNEGATLTVPAPGVLDGDVDPEGDTLTALLVSGPANASAFTLNSDGSFAYTHNGSETTTDSFTYRAVANGLQSAPATVTITITPVNDPPAITAGGTLNYTEGQPAQAIDTTITVADGDSPNLANATVQITGNYANGQDLLAFTPAFGIIGFFVPATGTLTLSGSTLVANYQAALRTVTYVNTSNNPSTAPRTVSWTVYDGSGPSNAATSTITVVSVNSAPIGGTDTWETFGNTELRVGTGTAATPHVLDATPANGVLANDIDPEGNPIAVTGLVGAGCGSGVFTCATTGGGTVTIQANGTFNYTPQAGDVTSDSFQYIVTDTPASGLPASVNVTVNLTLHGRIWYVDGAVAGPGTGTSSDPFSALPATIGDADDFIFVHDSTVTGGITLQNGQKLYGEGFGLSINQALNGNPAPAVLVAPGNNPVINATAGNAVGVLANSANGSLTNVEIRGLTLATTAATSNAIDITSADAANVAVTISDVVVNGATAEGIDINQGSTGTATVAISDVTVTSTGTGIDLNETAGTMTVTGFSGITIAGDTGGSGIVVTNATFDATAGGAYNQVAGGVTAVGDAGNPVGLAGVVLTNVSGALAFTDLDIFTTNGAGLLVSGTGAVDAAAGTGTLVSVASSVATLQSTGGPVVGVNNATADLPLASASVTSSPTTGIILLNVASGTTAASVSATAGSITNTTGISVNVDGGTVSLNYGGNITKANSFAMVSVSGGHTTGTITFSGTLNASSGPGLVFDNADSTTSYNFTGTTTLNGGDAGIDILNGSAGTFSFGTGTTITNPTGTAFFLSGSNANVTYSGSISDNTGFAVDITGHTAGTVTFQTGSITSTGTGIQVANSGGGTINFNSPTIALTTGGSKAVTLDVGNAGGTINFNPGGGGTGLDITTTSGTGFSALGGGTIGVQGSGNSITSTGGTAIDVGTTIIGASGLTFGTTSSGGGANGVKLASVTGGAISLGTGTLAGATSATFLVGNGAGGANTGGTSAITYGGTITAPGTARAVDIQDRSAGAGNITLSGTITRASGSTSAIFLDGNAAGTVAFTGPNSVLNGGTSTAVSLTNNTGATINFTGNNLDIDATSGGGFHATGGGTVNVTGTGHTITTTTGTALNVANTTIGASRMTFQSISASGAANGILLNNTGASGGLTVTGTGNTTVGGDNSGGTIQNTSGFGISLTSTFDPSFTNVRVMATTGHGVGGTDVTNFTFHFGRIDASNVDASAATEEANIGFYVNETNSTRNNLDGIVSIVGNQLTNARFHGIDIFNFSGTITSATISGNTITSTTSTATSQGGGVRLIAFGSATTIANVTAASIINNIVSNFPSGWGIQVQGGNGNLAGPAGVLGTAGHPTNKISITGNQLTGGPKFGTFAIVTAVNGRGQGNFDISNNGTVANPITNSIGTAISVGSFGFANTTATINNNVIVANNQAGAQGIGAGTSATLSASETPNLEVTITNNTISATDGNGILVTARDATGLVRAKIQNNTVAAPLAGNRNGIRVDAGNGISINDRVCLNISGNTTAGVNLAPEGIGLRKQGTVAGTNSFALHGFGTSPATGAQTVTFVSAQNPGSANGTLIISGDNFNFPTCSFP